MRSTSVVSIALPRMTSSSRELSDADGCGPNATSVKTSTDSLMLPSSTGMPVAASEMETSRAAAPFVPMGSSGAGGVDTPTRVCDGGGAL